jgi:hypothetical protein
MRRVLTDYLAQGSRPRPVQEQSPPRSIFATVVRVAIGRRHNNLSDPTDMNSNGDNR